MGRHCVKTALGVPAAISPEPPVGVGCYASHFFQATWYCVLMSVSVESMLM